MDDRLEGSSFLTDIPNHVPNRVPEVVSECASVLERRFMVRVPEVQGLQLLSMLRSFRERGLLFDFTVRVQGQSFPCHRCVIAGCSDFFRAMFEVDMRERHDRTVTLGNQSAAAVSTFLDFAYSGETVVTDRNVDMLFQLSSFLQVSVLSKACSDFLIGTLDLSNCLTLLALAEGYGSAPLLQRANEFVLQNFHQLALSSDFLDMQVNVLEACLQSDALSVPTEEAVMMSLLRWVGHDLQGRRSLLPRLLGLVRLHHLPAETLKALCVSEALLQENEGCVQLLDDASARQRKFSGLLGDARPSTTHSYIYVHKTEENGEIHHTFCYLLEADQWRELPRSPVVAMVPDPPGSYLSAYAEQMFVTGGCRGNCCRAVRLHVAEAFHEATDEVWRFCPVSRTYTPASPMGKPRTMHVAVNALNRLYVIGGRTRGPRDGAPPLLEVEFYDPLSCTWSTVSPLPTAIYYPEASTCGSTIYTLGSQLEISDSFNPSLDCFYQYRVVEDQWSRLVAEFGQFFHATLVKAVAINDTLHLCDLSTYKVYSFCPETCVWKGQGSFECAGFNAGAVGSKDKIYILGGDYSPDEITDEVQVYQSGRSQWEEVAPMPRALTEFHCQIISFNSYRDPWWLEDDTT